ncbi:MAG: hydroxysqualene dehydroxylase HpnE [Candidatus Accumulibacter sp.]|nr:hydroxysqualene dehydroxylase HpnE [Accumulibacter sp.]
MRAAPGNARIAVVGAGWAGLAAAVELCAAGMRPVVFEAAKQIGGRARRVEFHGHPLDNGQHILAGAYHETLRVMKRVGADPERLFHRFPLEIEHALAGFRLALPESGNIFGKTLNLAGAFFTAQGAPFDEKIAGARFVQSLKRRGFRLAEDCAASELYDRGGLRGKMRRYFWDPICLSALNTPPEKASAQILANVLRDTLDGAQSDTDFLLPATDMSALFPDAAAAFIDSNGGELRLQRRVGTFRSEAKEIFIDEEAFGHVILAVAPQHALTLLESHAEARAAAEILSTYAFETIGTVYAAYPEDVGLPARMRGMECDAPGAIGQWVFDRGRLDERNRGIFSFVLSSSANGWEEYDDDALALRLHRELETLLKRTLPAPRWTRVVRDRRATLSCRPKLRRPSAETPIEGLQLAGDYVYADYPATIESAVRSGVAAAARVVEKTRIR